MPYGSGRSDVAGNLTGKNLSGRSGSAGNVEGKSPKLNYRTSGSESGRSGAPGNDSRSQLPTRATGSMQGRTGKPSSKGVPGKSHKFNYQKSSGLLTRH